jgi:hypothetical protein
LCKSDCEPVDKSKSLDEPHRTSDNYEIFSSTYVDRRRIQRDVGQSDDNIPPRFNLDRYSAMVDHSPFAIATAVALPAATPDFAKDLYVANAARSPEGDMVTIASSSDQNFKKIPYYQRARGRLQHCQH